MRRQHGGAGRGLPLDRRMRPDTVLLRRELRWTAATVLTLGAAGYAAAGAYGATIGAGAGFVLQQAVYRVAVAALWGGWWARTVTHDGPEGAQKLGHITLRAFALWMRKASASERLYVALWNVVDVDEDTEDEIANSKAEVRIRQAYAVAARLDNEPLWCDNLERRRLRRSLQRDEARLIHLATGEHLQR